MATGSALWGASHLSGRLPLAVAATTALLVLALELLRIPPPASSWRIPRQWTAGRPRATAALFGLLLGIGFMTAISSAGLYLLWAWAVSAKSFTAVLPPLVAFGLARSAPLVAIHAATNGGERDLVLATDRLAKRLQHVRSFEVVALALAAGILIARL